MNPKRVLLAGGSGFLGRALTGELLARNYEVIVLTRSPHERGDGVREAEWDGQHIGEWIKYLEGAEAVVNLAGRSINCPHTPENLREITESRVNSVRAIAAAICHVAHPPYHVIHPPRVWVQAGAVGFYGARGAEWCDETTPNGGDKLAEVCRNWENAFQAEKDLDKLKTRRVLLRTGFVLGRDGGMLPVLAKLTKWFLGGTAGSGRQYISWIHIADLTRMYLEAIERDTLAGTFNATSPQPVTNADFMRELQKVLHRAASLSAPEWAVRLGARWLKTEPSLVLTGCRCSPNRFLEAGFQFQFPELRGALKNLYG
jgi:hypothetical protein